MQGWSMRVHIAAFIRFSIIILLPVAPSAVRANDPTPTPAPTNHPTLRANRAGASFQDLSSENIQRLQADIPVRRVIVDPMGALTAIGGASLDDQLIHANTNGPFLFRPGAGNLIADDLITTAVEDCDLSAYVVTVGGGGDGTGEGFTVQLALYEQCPEFDGRRIPRTGRVVDLPDDGVFEVVVDLSSAPQPIPPDVWVGCTFSSDRGGWVFGFPPELGFSADGYSHPFTGCNTFFGGFPRFPHASFDARLQVTGDCPAQFVGYRAFRFTTSRFALNAGILVADDINLAVEGCELAAYEVGIVGDAGPYLLELELRRRGPGDAIAGTHRVFEGTGDGSLEVARFAFPPGTLLPESFWMTWQSNTEATGVTLARRTQVGTSQDVYAVLDPPGGPAGWSFRSFDGDPPAVFNVSIHCHGPAPTGACCVEASDNSEACTDDVTELGCIGRWLANTTCEENLFTPPCGASACCLPDETCANLSGAGCSALSGVSETGLLCMENGQRCPIFACLTAEDVCLSEHDSPGCNDIACCDDVCRLDDWCCRNGWDAICIDEAAAICPCAAAASGGCTNQDGASVPCALSPSAVCPAGAITWLNPAGGTVDARQPFDLVAPSLPMGVDVFVVTAPAGATEIDCWAFHETGSARTPHIITGFSPDGEVPNGYRILIDQPITSGEVTSMIYGSDGCVGSIGTFTAQPADSDANGTAAPSDVPGLIDCCLKRVRNPSFGEYSCDIDHSGGSVGVTDLTRLVDLLNGAGAYDAIPASRRQTNQPRSLSD